MQAIAIDDVRDRLEALVAFVAGGGTIDIVVEAEAVARMRPLTPGEIEELGQAQRNAESG